MTLSPQFLDELRDRTTLSALIGKTVKLQRKGREFAACCPFHNEKTPSFYVNDEKGFYHCFGCSAHGDAIRFLTEARGLPFMDAVKELAAAAGMEMPAPDPRAAERAERAMGLTDVMEAAAIWFQDQLAGLEGGEARAYLQRRGVTPATIKAFGLGFAPDSRGKLRSALKSFGDAAMVECGLLIAPEDEREPYDRFRGRLMIPIRDQRGRTIAFGGRVIGQGEPKYLNSPETPLFDKGRTLFNLDRAGPATRKAERIVVVEGYMDVIALAQAGIDEAVAPLGTALTEGQLERLWKLADVPVLCFDGDGPGQKAALRATTRAMPMLTPGRSLSFLTLPAGQDPDDLVRAGGKPAFEALLVKPEPLVDRLWRGTLEGAALDTPEQRAGAKRGLIEAAKSIADPDVREQYVAEFLTRFDALFARKPPAMRNARQQPQARGRGRGTWTPPVDPRPQPATRAMQSGGIMGGSMMERMLGKGIVAGLLRFPGEVGRHLEALSGFTHPDPLIQQLLSALIDIAIRDRALDPGRLATILAATELDDIARDLLRADSLPFSFTAKEPDASRAIHDLDEAIQVLVQWPEVEASLDAATARLKVSFDDVAFNEQQRLNEVRLGIRQRLANLMQDDEGVAN